MKLTRKGKVLIIILVLVLIVLGYFTYKLIHLNQSIHDPQNTGKESKATQEKIKAKKPISIAIFGVDSDVDMDGFKKMIDIFDGVNVTSNATFNYNGSSFKEGKKENLSGDSALNYVRSRKEEGAGGDEGRTARQ